MNNQEVFNRVVTHLRAQGRKSVAGLGSDRPFCLYRGDDGASSCAVGCLIPDDVYTPEMEGRGIDELVEQFCVIEQLFAGVEYSLLKDLQHLHDTRDVEDWEGSFRFVARNHGLTVP
jgi:hypothetical protein